MWIRIRGKKKKTHGGAEVRHGRSDSLGPVEHDQACVAVAHEDLAEHVDAVICVFA